MNEGQENDAITFIPRKNIQFLGFSIYAALVTGFPCTGELAEEYQCDWTVKISGEVVK
jgi:hypothetical protein